MGQGSYDADVAAELGGTTLDFDAAQMVEERQASRNYRESLYASAKRAKSGCVVTCPSCLSKFKKKSYQQAFCCNKGRNNCKDFYWNRANDERLIRAAFRQP